MNYTMAIEVNNKHKFNVDEQQDDIKCLKEKCDLDNEDEVQEVTTASTPMMKNTHVYVCDMQSNICNKNGLKKHIQEEHTELL